ncbi:uncharacterized protein LOC124254794 [Haliotis rubra]|uniref:uncharacterized protein LOC124254794 n=1 Tax=Haliotis rubra TaxID=36100 RepID=UPI001EE5A62E|nr:uncharacterized protein LOC124254794 [Haliotis rubra]
MNITRPTHFDDVSASAYVKDVPDEMLCRLGRLAPKDLTAQERVRFLEQLVASVPDDHNSEFSVEPKASTSSAGASDRNRCDTLGDDMELDTQDDIDSVFSMTTHSSWSSQSHQSQVRINWTECQVRLLITLRQQYEHLFTSSIVTQKQAWKKVADEMTEKGYCYSGDECQRKFGSLRLRYYDFTGTQFKQEMVYKTIKDRNNKTGRGRSTWKFFSLMDEMYAGDPAVEPAEVSSLQNPKNLTRAPNSPERERSDCVMRYDSPNTSNSKKAPAKTTPKTPVSRRGTASLADLSEMREQQKKQHEERMEVEKKKISN